MQYPKPKTEPIQVRHRVLTSAQDLKNRAPNDGDSTRQILAIRIYRIGALSPRLGAKTNTTPQERGGPTSTGSRQNKTPAPQESSRRLTFQESSVAGGHSLCVFDECGFSDLSDYEPCSCRN